MAKYDRCTYCFKRPQGYFEIEGLPFCKHCYENLLVFDDETQMKVAKLPKDKPKKKLFTFLEKVFGNGEGK